MGLSIGRPLADPVRRDERRLLLWLVAYVIR
jgi:hypothetical protein